MFFGLFFNLKEFFRKRGKIIFGWFGFGGMWEECFFF